MFYKDNSTIFLLYPKLEIFSHVFYVNTGNPSLCYVHDGDGVCENFELKSSVRDCGFFRPEGFYDQWATRAVSNQETHLPFCSTDAILGPASPDEVSTHRSSFSNLITHDSEIIMYVQVVHELYDILLYAKYLF